MIFNFILKSIADDKHMIDDFDESGNRLDKSSNKQTMLLDAFYNMITTSSYHKSERSRNSANPSDLSVCITIRDSQKSISATFYMFDTRHDLHENLLIITIKHNGLYLKISGDCSTIVEELSEYYNINFNEYLDKVFKSIWNIDEQRLLRDRSINFKLLSNLETMPDVLDLERVGGNIFHVYNGITSASMLVLPNFICISTHNRFRSNGHSVFIMDKPTFNDYLSKIDNNNCIKSLMLLKGVPLF